MKNPKVTVLIATWNRADCISRAIESVRAQTFTDWELVVADDGSTDDTPRILEALVKKDGRIKYLKFYHIGRVSVVSNSGLRSSRGEYIAVLDSDDWWSDTRKLEKQVAFLDLHKEYVGCGGGMIVVDKKGGELYRFLNPETDGEIRSRMLFGNPIANSTAVFRALTAAKAGFYDESFPYSADREFWLRMGLQGKLYNFPEHFSYYTMNEASDSLSHLKLHMKFSLEAMKKYKNAYSGYYPALMFNYAQYWYSFLPAGVRRSVHGFLARLKHWLIR